MLYLFVAFSLEASLHVVQTVKELKQSYQTANYFNLQKSFLLDLILSHSVIDLGHLCYDIH